MAEKKSRRDFIKNSTIGAVAITTTAQITSNALAAETGSNSIVEASRDKVFATGRVLGANDRINIGFVGCGGRMNYHIDYLIKRAAEKGDVHLVAVNDIYEKRKQNARQRAGVDERSVHHDYRELCARQDIDVVVIASPDHWHYLHTMEALKAGKDVYLEKPMTYTVEEAKEITEAVKKSKRVLQVGSQYTSMDHFWKARKAIQDGLIGKVVWASGGFGRNRNKNGEWNYKMDPEANEKNLDWKAFLGPAPKREFSPERYFRWRKYWDYSGGIATDLFYHTISPLLLAISQEFPLRVTSSGGIFLQKDREVPDTFFTNADYKSFTIQLACSVASGIGAPLVIHGSEGTIMISDNSESLQNSAIQVIPDVPYAEEFKKKTGEEKLSIAVEKANSTHPHMDNLLECVRSRKDPHLPAELGYKAMTAIRMAVESYRKNAVLYFDSQREKVRSSPTKA
jgi:predicted dehydrogenase